MARSDTSDFATVQHVIEVFEAAASAGDAEDAGRFLHSVWRSKVAVGQMNAKVETRDIRLSDIAARRVPGPAPQLTSIQLCSHDLAIARAEHSGTAAAVLYLLLRERGGGWRIVGEASAAAHVGRRPVHFENRRAEAAVLDVLGEYYRAVTEGDSAAITEIFSSFWEMKNHEDGEIVAEDRASFLKRIEAGPLPGYWDDRQIADVQIVYDRLAYIRIDKPSTPSTTAFLLMKLADNWRVIDKIWIDGRVRI